MRASCLLFPFAVTALLAASSTACSSSSSSGVGADDAGADVGRPVQQDSGSDPFGGGGGRDGGGDAADGGDGGVCAQLKAQIDKLGTTARACNPSASSAQCNGQTNGPCCPISVSAGTDPGTIENYDQAVKDYVASCSPDCTKIICQQTPSDICDGTGSSGICR